MLTPFANEDVGMNSDAGQSGSREGGKRRNTNLTQYEPSAPPQIAGPKIDLRLSKIIQVEGLEPAGARSVRIG